MARERDETYDPDALRRGITAMEHDVDTHREAIRELEKRIDNYRFHLREALAAGARHVANGNGKMKS